MARIELDMESDLPPERILGALTDFSDRRPDLWPGLRREAYKVYATGDTWAEIREGSGGNVWARGRYDWSTPGQVTWTVQEAASRPRATSSPRSPRREPAAAAGSTSSGSDADETYSESSSSG